MNETHILIVDDDHNFQSIIEIRLGSFLQNAVFHKASDLQHARDLLQAKSVPFDLVMLDQHLPDGRGILLLNEGLLDEVTVLAVSSDNDPEIPGSSIQAGAAYFLAKTAVSEPLFKPLVLGIVDRNRMQRDLAKFKSEAMVTNTIRTLVSTLKHEINNPLGAVLGAAFLLKTSSGENSELNEAARLVEDSGKRIKHVLDQLCDAVSLQSVVKSHQEVFHIPGDKPWQKNS